VGVGVGVLPSERVCACVLRFIFGG